MRRRPANAAITVGLAALLLVISTAAPRGTGAGPGLGDVIVETDTLWPEGSFQADSLIIRNGATLAIAGGSTLGIAKQLSVIEGSMLVLQGKNVAAPVDDEWQGEGVAIEAGDVTIAAGSLISVDGQGYAAAAGPGAGGSDGGTHGGSGGGYGGIGGRAGDAFHAGGPSYGAPFAPLDLGSGGGPTRTAAGSGGGAIALDVRGTLTLDGTITADGSDAATGNCFSAPAGGGGAGGSIFITAATITGTGTATANGGNGADGGCFPGVGDDGGGGAGGRIALFYDDDAGFAGFTTSSVSGGSGGGHVGAPGTMVFIDRTTNALRISQNLELPSDSSVRFGAVTVDDGGTLTLGGGSTLTIENDLVVTGDSAVILKGKNTADPVDDDWRGAGVTIRARNAQIDPGSLVSAAEQGYLEGRGPGAGGADGGAHGGAGGGHGGVGGRAGDGFNAGGPAYGAAFAPLDLGSGGGPTSTAAGRGGGAIRLDVSETLTLGGTIIADGGNAAPGNCFSAPAGGGGAGGSIYITAATVTGNGTVTADGGNGADGGCFPGVGDDGGGGAGGRIAVFYDANAGFPGFATSSVGGGSGGGHVGAPGTMVFIDRTTNALRISQNLELPPDSSVRFGAVTVDDGGTLTLGGGSTLTVDGDLVVTDNSTVIARGKNTGGQVSGAWQGTGVTIDANRVRVDAGSTISADAQGYAGGQGPGAGGSDGAHGGAGGGHGGVGGRAGDGINDGGPAYGDGFAPVELGSGGGVARSLAGSGGGAIAINVSDTLMLDGSITANGSDAGSVGCSLAGSGGGSGGSLFVNATTIAGAGSFTAMGGAGGEGGCTGTGDDGGGGAGGRIAVRYANDAGFGGFAASSAAGGGGGGHTAPPGTMAFLDTTANALRIAEHFDFAAGSSVTFGAVTVDDGATLTLGGGTRLTVENDLIVTDHSTVFVQGTNRNGQVNGGWEGAGVTIRAGNVRLDAGSAISADMQGYLGGQGPGVALSDGAHAGGGGGYGGTGGPGGDRFNPGGPTYGTAVAPVDLGSGGSLARSAPGSGGGAVALYATDTLMLDGTITASGGDAGGVACSLTGAGGGSGGSIVIGTTFLAGQGSLQAAGGAGGEGGCTGNGDDGGGGGGGRIAIYYSLDAGFAGFDTSTAGGGLGGSAGAPGTIVAVNCAGDCNADGRVTIDELVRIVAVALDDADVDACIAGDERHDGTFTVSEMIGAVNRALSGCPAH